MTKDNSQKTAKVVDSLTDDEVVVKLSTGVVLSAKQANPITLIKVMSSYPQPEVPTFKDPNSGRMFTNPDDPDYIERKRLWQMEYTSAMLDAMILLGTEVKSVPKGFPKPESDKWLEQLSALNLPLMPENKSWRYLAWVQNIAVANEKDFEEIQNIVGRLSGVSEADVEMTENFPGSD